MYYSQRTHNRKQSTRYRHGEHTNYHCEYHIEWCVWEARFGDRAVPQQPRRPPSASHRNMCQYLCIHDVEQHPWKDSGNPGSCVQNPEYTVDKLAVVHRVTVCHDQTFVDIRQRLARLHKPVHPGRPGTCPPSAYVLGWSTKYDNQLLCTVVWDLEKGPGHDPTRGGTTGLQDSDIRISVDRTTLRKEKYALSSKRDFYSHGVL